MKLMWRNSGWQPRRPPKRSPLESENDVVAEEKSLVNYVKTLNIGDQENHHGYPFLIDDLGGTVITGKSRCAQDRYESARKL